MSNSHIILSTLDGFGFEELCAEIYRRMGYEVQNVRDTGDEGRDLILRNPNGETIVAECKHWPRGTVGRPVVQKLHSAMITLPAGKGALLTTGSFAKQARDYVQRLKEPIELIDGAKIKDFAARVGITILNNEGEAPILSYRISDSQAIKQHLDTSIFNAFISSPGTPSSLFSLVHHSVQQRAMYLVRYSVSQEFATTLGVIHTIYVPNGVLLVDADDGSLLARDQTDFLMGSSTVPFAGANSPVDRTLTTTFALGAAELNGQAKDHVARLHRAMVSYRGRNGQTYAKDCTPSKRNIFLRDIQQVYVPQHSLQYRVLSHSYSFNLIDNGRAIHWLRSPEIFSCAECLKAMQSGSLCNSCGKTAHGPRLLFPHSFRCKACDKTICKSCAHWVKRWVIFKSVLCHECASAHGAAKASPVVRQAKRLGARRVTMHGETIVEPVEPETNDVSHTKP